MRTESKHYWPWNWRLCFYSENQSALSTGIKCIHSVHAVYEQVPIFYVKTLVCFPGSFVNQPACMGCDSLHLGSSEGSFIELATFQTLHHTFNCMKLIRFLKLVYILQRFANFGIVLGPAEENSNFKGIQRKWSKILWFNELLMIRLTWHVSIKMFKSFSWYASVILVFVCWTRSAESDPLLSL